MNEEGYLIVIDGPSAVGKSTIFRALLAQTKVRFELAKRTTTREKRPHEDDEDIYDFISHDEFQRMVRQNEFVEHKCYKFGMCYGLPKKNVLEPLSRGINLIAMINLGNIQMVRGVVPRTFGVFLTASLETVRKRLLDRGTHPPEQIEERLGNAAGSVKFKQFYDLVLLNENRPVESVVTEITEQFIIFRRIRV
jgi:guanylate kinase